MKLPSSPLDRLSQALSRLPGIGEKTATRLALFLLRDTKGAADEILEALVYVKEKVRLCEDCQNISEEAVCPICRDTDRDAKQVCVVQEPVDLMSFERIGEYRGLYHVLHGALSPLEGVGPDDIRLNSLMGRLKAGKIREIILATNSNPEGEATALYLRKLIGPLGLKITRIATGIPVGGLLEYTDPKTLARALSERRNF